ncbi:Ent-kaurene oxidase [Pyrenophora teres f. maculata]|nr:Ent-kaurene oxidase [Pyrenophora teres f. maculata]CAA9967181.1 Ent-kaurene oxidase [Pyrenophora teres f. maculata]
MNARVENRWYSNISLGDIVMYKLKPTTFYYAPPFYILILCFVAFASVGILTGVSSRAIPLINPRGWLDTFGKTQKLDYIQNCAKLIRQGQDMFPGKPFRLATDMGGVVILPVDWAHDVRNNPHLSLNEAMRADFHAGYPGFEPYTAGFADDGLLLTVTRKYLTKHAEIFNRPLSAETSYVLDEKFGNSPGPEACRNPAWLKIVKSYGVNSVQAAQALRLWPKWLRGVANKFLPTCRQLQLQITEGRDIVNTILEKRRTLLRKGNDPSLEKASNLVDWFEKESAGRPYDLVACQLLLSLAAMHATSDLINEMLISIVRYPELVDEIRSEIIKVIPVHGFTRAGMFNLMLLDSVIKESQRHKSEPGQYKFTPRDSYQHMKLWVALT